MNRKKDTSHDSVDWNSVALSRNHSFFPIFPSIWIRFPEWLFLVSTKKQAIYVDGESHSFTWKPMTFPFRQLRGFAKRTKHRRSRRSAAMAPASPKPCLGAEAANSAKRQRKATAKPDGFWREADQFSVVSHGNSMYLIGRPLF